uniref:Dynactin subunit 1 n=1 Tax=Glossina morsitans morsitans TaxID=37546 RepID=A0A1B0G155_GLOMM
MSEHSFKVGQKVQIAGRQLEGRIAYIGLTNFAPGKWIGVVLNDERGKNNGTIRGITYFKCAPNYGIFVRPTQLLVKRTHVVEADRMEEQTDAIDRIKEQPKLEVASQEKVKSKSIVDSTPTPTPTATPTPTPKTVPKLGSCTNLLKTTKINQPKEVKSLLPSTSQLSLLNTVGPCGALRPPPPLAPKRSKTSMSPSESFCCAKRSAFVETGFLEILRPQFIPGQPLRSPTFNSMVLSTSSQSLQELQQHNKNLEARINELNSEIDLLKQQKSEDKRKLMEMERLRLQNKQLLEFKVRIIDQQTSLQRELQRLRQDLRECNELKVKYQKELDEAAENIELLTLDKEMAEERAETLQIELEIAQEQNEELALDIEILKAENERFLIGVDNQNIKEEPSQPTLGEVRKMEQYNQRLRETVIKLRDVLTEEKQHALKAVKELETRNSEIAELKKTKEMLTKRCDVMESHIIDLREQVDAALGAETMVSTLANAKLELEEKVRLLEEEVVELEALEEIHEQLIESNQDLERDLREEVDLLNAQIRTLQQEKDVALETVYERDCTIMKFRALVKSLNERDQLKDQVTLTPAAITTATVSTSEDMSSISSNPEFIPGIDFQQVFASTKAYGRALDFQLSSVELKMSQLHVEYLKAFLPEELLLRGGAYDVILVLLLMQRSIEKVDIVCTGIHEKFPASCEFGRDAIFEGFSVHRFAFRTKCLYLLRSLRMVLQQLEFALNHCDYEICTHAAIYRCEMETQEKQLDELLRLLKKGLLDENTQVEALERAVGFFNSLLTNLFATQNLAELLDEQRLYIALIEVYDVALDCVNTHAGLLYTIIKLGDEHTDSFCSMQFLMEHARSFKQQLKQMQRKLPTNSLDFHKLQWTQMQRLNERNDHLSKLINFLSSTAREATKDIATASKNQTTNEIAIDHERLWRIILLNCSRMATEDFEHNPVMFFQNCVQLMQEQLNDFQRFIAEGEKARNSNLNTVYVRSNDITILQQANEIKKHYDEIKFLHHQLSEKDKEMRALKQVVKAKQNDYSELQIRKEMAEKQLQKISNEQEHLLQCLGTQMEELLEEMQNRHLETLQTLQNHEARLRKLEETQKNFHQSLDTNTRSFNTTSHEAFLEIERLYQCLKQQREFRVAQQSCTLKNTLRQLQPLHLPQLHSSPVTKQRLAKLSADVRHLKNSWILAYISLNSKTSRDLVLKESSKLSQHIWDVYAYNHGHRFLPTDFAKFPSKDIKQILLQQ